VSLYPWRPACGCLIDEVDGEPTLLEWCQRHDGCRLVVTDASYPPVTTGGSETFAGLPGTDGLDPGGVTTEHRYEPSDGTHSADSGTAGKAEGGQ
jgi:hypothetical protein